MGSRAPRAAVSAVIAVLLVAAGFTVWVSRGGGGDTDRSPRLDRFLPSVINTRALAVSDDAVWIAGDVLLRSRPGLRQEVHRLDPNTGRVVARLEVPAVELGLAGGALWAWDGYDLRRIDVRTNRLTQRVRVRAPQETDYDTFEAADMLVTDDAVWIGSEREVLRFDLATGRVTRRVALDGRAGNLSAGGDGTVWVHIADNLDVDVNGVDPHTNRVTRRVRCACWIVGSTSDGRLWAQIDDGVGPLTLPRRQSEWARVHDILAVDMSLFDLALVDDTFWWTRTSAATVPADDVVEVLSRSDVDTAVRSGFATSTSAVTVRVLGPFAVHDGTAWCIGWRPSTGFRLYHWVP